MNLGRGFFPVDEMASFHDELVASFRSADETIDYLMHGISLPDYLEFGLEELVRHSINPNKLPLKRSRSRRQSSSPQ